jgi:2-dehydropantoate 2-reductase
MGSLFGGLLSAAGEDVTLVDVWKEHLEAIAAKGLTLELSGGRERVAHPAVALDPSGLAEVDAVIVLTKGWATAEAAASIKQAVSPQTWVVTFQNGLGHDDVLAATLDSDRVVLATTVAAAQLTGPGRAKVDAVTERGDAPSHIGVPRGSDTIPDDLREMAAALTRAGLPTDVSDDSDVLIWNKLALNAAMGPATALEGCTVGEVWSNEHGRGLATDLFDEIVAVGLAEGVNLDRDSLWVQANQVWDSVGSIYPSMAVDVRTGRRTEIDFLCLEIARRGARNGADAPVSRTVGRAIKLAEALRQSGVSG